MASSIASTYDDLAAGYERYGASASPELYATLREVGLVPDARVLDVGVGTGRAGATHDAGLDPVPEPLAGGFRAFYGSEGFADRTVRALQYLYLGRT